MIKKVRLYWPLIKSLQTGLLLSTGIAGYFSSMPPIEHFVVARINRTVFSLRSAEAPVMNMWYDRDIDTR